MQKLQNLENAKYAKPNLPDQTYQNKPSKSGIESLGHMSNGLQTLGKCFGSHSKDRKDKYMEKDKDKDRQRQSQTKTRLMENKE